MATSPKYPNRAPPPEERDRTLGAFIDAWDSLDQHAKQVFSALLGVPNEIAKIVFGLSWESNRFRQMLSILGKARLQDVDVRALNSLGSRLDKMATWRNRIVHGHWYAIQGHPTFRGDRDYGAIWVRIYDPVDSDDFYLVMTPDKGDQKHAKARAKFGFDVPRIQQLTCVCKHITFDWNEFSKKLRTRALPGGQLPPLPPKLPLL